MGPEGSAGCVDCGLAHHGESRLVRGESSPNLDQPIMTPFQIVFAIGVPLAIWAWLFWLPFACGACGRLGTIKTWGHSVAGEYMASEAWCESCKVKIQIDGAGYLVTDAAHLFRRAVPEPDAAMIAAQHEVDEIAP